VRRLLVVLIVGLAATTTACGGGGASGSPYCKALKDLLNTANAKGTTTVPSSTDDLNAAFQKYSDALKNLEAKSPSKLKPDYVVVRQYFNLLLQARTDPTKVNQPDFKAVVAKVPAANDHITKYNNNTCKVTTPTSAASSNATTSTVKK
jgi:hypothetical protein